VRFLREGFALPSRHKRAGDQPSATAERCVA
jgi:hypothetical protein